MLPVACLFGGVKPDVVVGSLALLRPVVAPEVDAAWPPGWSPLLDGPALGCFFGGGGFLLLPLLVDAAVLTFDEEP